ncbi:hypothetical protein [Clostridium chrysemydis]|uniref:hypothetical protein n=1 Tax=Clostridium chrysemydis TaxID=2665504 RepID=UPI001883A8B7|nr:hypothetical protein [Clostridium chrysemydis]
MNAESINDLPYIDCYGDGDKQEFLYEIFSEYCEFITKDGTKIICEEFACQCFEDKQNHCCFYNVNNEFYICAECGMKMKYYSDIWNEVIDKFELEEYLYEEIALPKDWNENGVRKYYENYFEKQKIQQDRLEQRRIAREREMFLNYGCSDCIHMKRCECEYGNDEDNCDDFECR